MIGMVGFRNISVHDYREIDEKVVHGIIEHGLDDFEQFYTAIYNRAKDW